MKLEQGDLHLGSQEIVAAARYFNVTEGELSRLPGALSAPDDREVSAAAACFGGINETLRDGFRHAFETIANPTQIGMLHSSIGDESIQRFTFAFGPELPDQAVLMWNHDGEWRIGLRTLIELVENITSALLTDETMLPTGVGVALPPDAMILLLAICSALRRDHLYGLLTHHESNNTFTKDAVEEALGEAQSEDFRWALNFVDKLLPNPIASIDWKARFEPCLRDLITAKLVVEVQSEEGPAAYAMTEEGHRISLVLRKQLTKVGLRLTTVLEGGERGHDVFLFVRSFPDLLFFNFSGRVATVGSLVSSTLHENLARIFEFEHLLDEHPAVIAGVVQTAQVESEPTATRSCPTCGTPVDHASASCPACGMAMPGVSPETAARSRQKTTPAPPPTPSQPEPEAEPETAAAATRFCFKCGATLDSADAAFCRKCGAKL